MDDLEALKTKWLGICGACDAGMGECSHPDGDYRPVMLELVREVERLRAGLKPQYGIGEKGRIAGTSSRAEAEQLAPYSGDKLVYVREVGPWRVLDA